MLTRLFITTAILGMWLMVPSGVAVADDKPDVAVAPRTPDGPPTLGYGWDEDQRPPGPRGRQPQPIPFRPGGRQPGPVIGAPIKPVPEMTGRQNGSGMGGGMGGPGMGMGGGLGRSVMGMGSGMSMAGGMGMEPGMGRPGMGMGGGMGGPGMTNFTPDPEMYKILIKDRDFEHGSMQLSQLFHHSPEEAQAEVKKQIEEIVAEHFKVRQQRRQLELTRLEKELDRLKTAIKLRQEARDDIIKRRVKQLTGESDPLDF